MHRHRQTLNLIRIKRTRIDSRRSIPRRLQRLEPILRDFPLPKLVREELLNVPHDDWIPAHPRDAVGARTAQLEGPVVRGRTHGAGEVGEGDAVGAGEFVLALAEGLCYA